MGWCRHHWTQIRTWRSSPTCSTVTRTDVAHQIEPEVAVEPGSMGGREQANTETGPAGPLGAVPPHTAHREPGEDEVDGCRGPHRLSSQAPAASASPVRLDGDGPGVTGGVAKTYWLLDPSITVRERVARDLGDRLQSAREQRNQFPWTSAPGDVGMTRDGTITSTSSKISKVDAVAVHFNSAGASLGGNFTFVDFVPANGSTSIQIQAFSQTVSLDCKHRCVWIILELTVDEST